MKLMYFLSSFRYEVRQIVGRDSRTFNFGVILPLPPHLDDLIDQLIFSQVVRASDFDGRLSYLEYIHTKKVYWGLHTI